MKLKSLISNRKFHFFRFLSLSFAFLVFTFLPKRTFLLWDAKFKSKCTDILIFVRILKSFYGLPKNEEFVANLGIFQGIFVYLQRFRFIPTKPRFHPHCRLPLCP